MKATITSTDQIVEIDAPAANPVERMARPGGPIARRVMARAWEGVTENGVQFVAYIPVVQVHKNDDNSEFERDLREMSKKPEDWSQRAIDMRFIV